MSRETGKRSVWVNRVFTHLQAGQDVDGSGTLEKEKDRRLQSLHNELKVIQYKHPIPEPSVVVEVNQFGNN